MDDAKNPSEPFLQKFIGKTYNYLTVLSYVETKVYGKTKVKIHKVHCRCKCGTEKDIWLNNLLSGMTKSCGCRPYETKLGRVSVRKETKYHYRLYKNMIKACYHKSFYRYSVTGGRGIKVCSRWLASFPNFMQDVGTRPGIEYVFTRKDRTKDFTKENCTWELIQENYKRRHSSRSLTVANLARKTGYSRERIRQLSGISKQRTGCVILTPYIESRRQRKNGVVLTFNSKAIQFLINRKNQFSKESKLE